jgi:hypothetical protein
VGLAGVVIFLVGAGIATAWVHNHNPNDWVGPAVSAVATYLTFLLLLVAIFDRRFAFLPDHPLPAWLSIRSSFVLIFFFLGILVGHFVWG